MAIQNQKLKNAKTIPVRRRTKKGAIILVFVGLLALGIGGTVLALNLINSNSNSQSEEKNHVTENKETNNNATDNTNVVANDQAEKKAPAKYEGSDPNSYNDLTGIITFGGVSENQFVISVAIDQFITGSCKFEATAPDGSVITADVDIMAGPSSSFCSYSGPIPAVRGKYNVVVTPTSKDKTGTITGEVEI